MSNAPKKRPWFQIHLSTCVVLMFVAGGLLTFASWYCDYAERYYTCPELGGFTLWPCARWIAYALLLGGAVATLSFTAMFCEYIIGRCERRNYD